MRRRRPARLVLRLTGPMLAAGLGRVRQRIATWAAAAGMGPDDVDDIVLATHEALANVADHAYPDGGAEAWLEAGPAESDELRVLVRDHGRWRPPPADPGPRGHGMVLIAGLAQRVTVQSTDAGTTVAMYWRLPPAAVG
ncbi:ATP-binding protein [Pseudonocardia sp. GCM10023141]|uniref:ATP-binding protein n=1 Tax=Pseudonocardia sp. GCM10023141 TaxID=3252653 RepID=UPI003615D049